MALLMKLPIDITCGVVRYNDVLKGNDIATVRTSSPGTSPSATGPFGPLGTDRGMIIVHTTQASMPTGSNIMAAVASSRRAYNRPEPTAWALTRPASSNVRLRSTAVLTPPNMSRGADATGSAPSNCFCFSRYRSSLAASPSCSMSRLTSVR